jgi:hypothetical protein
MKRMILRKSTMRNLKQQTKYAEWCPNGSPNAKLHKPLIGKFTILKPLEQKPAQV